MKFHFIATLLVIYGVLVNISSCWILADSVYKALSLFNEVCHTPSINFKPETLENAVRSKVFGQPFVQDVILPLVNLHLDNRYVRKRALVMSFHGTPGSGKNYLSKIIAESIYANGMDSIFVHLFKPVLHFANQPPDILKLKVQQWIIGNVTSCDRQLFIFDEVNDMPEGVLEGIKPFIDYNPRFGGHDFSKCIFIFLSNIAMVPINQRALELWKSGIKREEFEIDEFRKTIIDHSFNAEGGFKKCQLITSRLIDAFVPFLPLERGHVISCIESIAQQYTQIPIQEETVCSILENVEFSPDGLNVYSTHGCKNLETPVKLALIKGGYRFIDEL